MKRKDKHNNTAAMAADELNNNRGLKKFNEFIREEDGMGTVEIILIIVVLIGLVIIFKTQITQLVQNIFGKITSQTNKI